MSGIFKVHRRKIIFGGVLAGLFVLGPYTPLPNPFHTPGVTNIEKRWSSGGGSKHHTPGVATKLGDSEDVEGNTANTQGIGSAQWQEQIGGQKPDVSRSWLLLNEKKCNI